MAEPAARSPAEIKPTATEITISAAHGPGALAPALPAGSRGFAGGNLPL